MQQINTERQQASVRLTRQLPANIIKETTSPIQHKHVNKISKSPPQRFDKLNNQNQQQYSVKNFQTDLDDFNTHRSLSSCPTYSSLSRHSPETRECATQITTITSTETTENDYDSSLPIDTNQILIVDEIPVEEVELMPISSGFGHYPYGYPTTITNRVKQPQIVTNFPKFRDKSQNGVNPNSKTKPGDKLPPPRPTAVKQQSPRSDISALPTKRNETNTRYPRSNPAQNGSRRVSSNERAVRNSTPPPPPEKKRTESKRRNDTHRSSPKYISSPSDHQELGRKPVRFLNKPNNSHRSSSPPAYYQTSAPIPRDASDRPRRVRVANQEYVIQRRRPPPEPVYDDYRSESPIERRRPQRVVRVRRDPPYREEEDDDVYYVERPRRPKVVRRAPPAEEYVYVDEKPASVRHRRSRRPEVVYVDEEQPVEYEDDYIYVDEDGNEVDFDNNRDHSPHYVEYIHDDDKDKRRSHKPKIVYVDDEPPSQQGRNKKKSKQPSSTRIVYE